MILKNKINIEISCQTTLSILLSYFWLQRLAFLTLCIFTKGYGNHDRLRNPCVCSMVKQNDNHIERSELRASKASKKNSIVLYAKELQKERNLEIEESY